MDEQWGSGCVEPALHSPPTDPFSIPWREILLGKTMLSEEMVGRKKLSTASTPLLRHLLRQQHFLNKKPQQATTTCLCISCVVFQSLTGVTKTLTRKEKKRKKNNPVLWASCMLLDDNCSNRTIASNRIYFLPCFSVQRDPQDILHNTRNWGCVLPALTILQNIAGLSHIAGPLFLLAPPGLQYILPERS